MTICIDGFNKLSKNNQCLVIMAILGYNIDKDGNILKPSGEIWDSSYFNSNSYKKVTFRPPAKYFGRVHARTVLPHRYQAFKKYGLIIFDDNICVRHLDNNKLNNSWDNIAIGTQSDNHHDNPAELNERNRKICMEAAQRANINKNLEKINKIRADRKLGLTYKELAEKYGVSKSTVCYHCGINTKRRASKVYRDMYS